MAPTRDRLHAGAPCLQRIVMTGPVPRGETPPSPSAGSTRRDDVRAEPSRFRFAAPNRLSHTDARTDAQSWQS
jgi:hypothetical protein